MNGIPLDPNPNITTATNAHLLPFHQESPFLDDSTTDPEIQPIRDQLGIDFDSSLTFNGFVAWVSASKVATTTLFLSIVHPSCFQGRATWLVLMLAFDLMYATLHIVKLKAMVSLQHLQLGPPNPAENGNRIQDIENILQQANDNRQDEANFINGIQIPLVDGGQRNMELTKKLERRKRWLSRIILLNDFLYLGLLVYGQLEYFVYEDACNNDSLNLLMLVYIIFGYIWLLLPLGVLVLACFCLPCVMCCYIAFNRSQVPANRAAIKKLPVKKFDEEVMTGSPECSICMMEYKNGDNIIQLGCSPLHYFHEDCLKKWLKINGQCPTCRMRLEDMKKD